MFDTLSDEELLNELDAEREKFTKYDRDLIRSMVDELVVRGVYPTETLPGNPNTVYQMVDGWGANWNTWTGPLKCPSCNADLRDPITGPPFLRVIGIYDHSRDGTKAWQCPDCQAVWSRSLSQGS